MARQAFPVGRLQLFTCGAVPALAAALCGSPGITLLGVTAHSLCSGMLLGRVYSLEPVVLADSAPPLRVWAPSLLLTGGLALTGQLLYAAWCLLVVVLCWRRIAWGMEVRRQETLIAYAEHVANGRL